MSANPTMSGCRGNVLWEQYLGCTIITLKLHLVQRAIGRCGEINYVNGHMDDNTIEQFCANPTMQKLQIVAKYHGNTSQVVWHYVIIMLWWDLA